MPEFLNDLDRDARTRHRGRWTEGEDVQLGSREDPASDERIPARRFNGNDRRSNALTSDLTLGLTPFDLEQERARDRSPKRFTEIGSRHGKSAFDLARELVAIEGEHGRVNARDEHANAVDCKKPPRRREIQETLRCRRHDELDLEAPTLTDELWDRLNALEGRVMNPIGFRHQIKPL